MEQGLYDEAIKLYERSLSMVEKAHGQNHPDTRTAQDNLILAYHDRKQHEAKIAKTKSEKEATVESSNIDSDDTHT
jgi:hypothetical protein